MGSSASPAQPGQIQMPTVQPPYNAPCPRWCSGAKDSSTNVLTGPSAHNEASLNSNKASGLWVRQPYNFVRKHDSSATHLAGHPAAADHSSWGLTACPCRVARGSCARAQPWRSMAVDEPAVRVVHRLQGAAVEGAAVEGADGDAAIHVGRQPEQAAEERAFPSPEGELRHEVGDVRAVQHSDGVDAAAVMKPSGLLSVPPAVGPQPHASSGAPVSGGCPTPPSRYPAG